MTKYLSLSAGAGVSLSMPYEFSPYKSEKKQIYIHKSQNNELRL